MQPLGRGHIHATFVASYRGSDGSLVRYVHQRVNTEVFPDVALLHDNLERVTAQLGAAAIGPRAGAAFRLCRTVDGGPLAPDGQGNLWRTLTFVEGATSRSRFDSPSEAVSAGAAAARFVADLACLPGPPLGEVVPGFHDVVKRLAALDDAASADIVGRVGVCRKEVDSVLDLAAIAYDVAAARVDGTLPDRIVHNDAKADNVLLDDRSGDAVCLVDLDTVGPGTVLFDVGDLIRSGAATTPEDGRADGVGVRADIVDAVLRGYAEAGSRYLTPGELSLLPRAAPLMALESAARFLTDHLQGDTYFRVDGPGHNLRRARNQLRLVELLS